MQAPVEDYAPPGGTFLVAHDAAGRAVGLRRIPPTLAGHRRSQKMYTRPEDCFGGIGRSVFTELEHRAAGCGARRIILETDIRNLAAVALYQNMGYAPMGSYVVGRDPGINRAFTKHIGSPRRPAAERRLPGL